MAAKSNKHYVVWVGKRPGIYRTWTECQAQVHGFPGAKFQAFKTLPEAQAAYAGGSAAKQPSKAGSSKASAPKSTNTKRGSAASSGGAASGGGGGGFVDHGQALAAGFTVIYSDGGSDPNPGPGGYGVVCMTPDGQRQETLGGFRLTTNNRMELMGWIEGLRLTEPGAQVAIFSDSKYVGDMYAKGFAHGWRDRGWKTSSKKAVANVDLWQTLLNLIDERTVRFTHVYGHTGVAENERCDVLTHDARRGELATDHGYEDGPSNMSSQGGLF